MPQGRFVLVLVSLALPAVASAQLWADAYRTGDYQKAADLLHPIVTDPDYEQKADPQPAAHLATLYARGLGVARDTISACAMAQAAHAALQNASPRYARSIERARAFDALLEDSDAFIRAQCGSLSYDERLMAVNAIACPAFGMPDQALAVGSRTVLVSRKGLTLAGSKHEPSTFSLCQLLVARVRAVSVQPTDDAAPGVTGRHFVEVLFWQRQAADVYVLLLLLFEVHGTQIVETEIEGLHTSPMWPRPALPPDFDSRFSLQMIRSGHVRWTFEGTPPRRGWIMGPEETRR